MANNEATYTGYISWESGETEQIDVSADSYNSAETQIKKELAEDYLPGGHIHHIEQRASGFYF